MTTTFTAADATNDEQPRACNGCSRRTFVTRSVLASVSALLLTNCGDGVIGGSGGVTGPINLTITLADYPALASIGGIARVSGASTPIAVVRSGAASYAAFSMVCPHVGTTIGINGNGFLCPNHGAKFNSSGQWVNSPQQTGNLTPISTTLNAAATMLTINAA